jgi:ATP-binding cassette subfamily B (MDR/TAP) protein 1
VLTYHPILFRGLGRKLGEGVQFLITFCGGLGYAFWASWQTSLVVLTIIPFMALSAWFLLKMNQSQSARNNTSYAEAGSIVYQSVAAIRTILSLNAVQNMIDKFRAATEKAYQVACSQIHMIGLANGSTMGSFLLSYIAVILFGSFLLYRQVRDNGCDPSGTTGNDKCNPAAVDVFGSLMGITFAAAVLPQVSACVEAFTGARAACFLATVAMNRKTGTVDDDEEMHESRRAARRGSTIPLPRYVIDSSSPDGLKPDGVKGRIEFRNVTFAYPTRKEINVFDGFSLDVPAGSTVALVGPR